jgi:hypothetical protein
MPRRRQPRGKKGSLKLIQDLVNLHPEVLDEAIEDGPVEWRSPLADDEYAEYWDQAFLDRLGVTLGARPLHTFWPRSGPRWDALGLVLGQRVVLVEAKAHVAEVESLSRAEGESRSMIQAAFAEVGRKWQVEDINSWLTTHYQYANRLAHAFLLNELNAIPTSLVFVHFIGAEEVQGPATKAEWQAKLRDMHRALGIHDRLPEYVRNVFVDVSGEKPVAI